MVLMSFAFPGVVQNMLFILHPLLLTDLVYMWPEYIFFFYQIIKISLKEINTGTGTKGLVH